MDNSYNFSKFSKQSPKGIIIIYFQNAYKFLKGSWAFFLPVLVGKSDFFKSYYFIGTIIIVLIYLLVHAILTFKNYQFKIEDNHFILKHGILRKKKVSIPFERIQNIKYKQNLIQQIIDVKQVEIETAGDKAVEISIKALSKYKADALKYAIYSNKIDLVNEIENEKIDKETTILKISFFDLLRESITENHLKSFLIVILTLSGLYSQMRDFVKDFSFKDTVGVNLEETTSTTNGIVFIIILGIVISVMVSFIKIILRHFDLSLMYKNSTLEIVQGLFVRKQQILKRVKVQSIVISTNPLKKILGISNVLLKQVSNAIKVGKKQLPTKIIACKDEHIEIIKNILYTDLNLENRRIYKPHKYYIFQLSLKGFFFLILVNSFLFISFSNYKVFFLNIGLIPIAVFMIYKIYQKAYFKFNETLLIRGHGSISTSTTYFEYYKLQTIKLKQTIFQKKRNIYDIKIQTASDDITLPCVNKADATKIYNYFLYQTEKNNKKWM